MIKITVFALTAALAQAQSPVAVPQEFANSRQGLRERIAPTPIPQTTLSPEMRGDIYMARKMYREASEMYLQMPHDSAITWNKVGIAYHQMLNFKGARKSYERSVKLNPQYPEAINNLGTIHYAQKSYRNAIKHYRRALKVNPSSASIYSNLGTAYFARKKYPDALQAYQVALQLDPEVFEHRNSNGVLLQERSVQERAKFYYYLARTYAKAKNHERALQYLRKALEEGFKGRDKLTEEPEFAQMQQLPEFQELLRYQPTIL